MIDVIRLLCSPGGEPAAFARILDAENASLSNRVPFPSHLTDRDPKRLRVLFGELYAPVEIARCLFSGDLIYRPSALEAIQPWSSASAALQLQTTAEQQKHKTLT